MISSSQYKTLPIYLPPHCPYCFSEINDRTVCMFVFLCPHIKRTWVYKCHWMDSSRLSYIKRNAICCYYCVKPRKLNSNSRSTTLLLLSVSVHLFFKIQHKQVIKEFHQALLHFISSNACLSLSCLSYKHSLVVCQLSTISSSFTPPSSTSSAS